jgi:hypothetical protein
MIKVKTEVFVNNNKMPSAAVSYKRGALNKDGQLRYIMNQGTKEEWQFIIIPPKDWLPGKGK